MPSSGNVGVRPSMASMRAYSSGLSLPGHTLRDGAEHARQDIGRRGLHQRLRLAGIEPHAVAMRALVDLDAIPVVRDEVIPALGALHIVLLALALGGGLLRRGALLPQQLRVAACEVLVFVLTRFIVRHGLGGGGAGGGAIWSVSPPRVGTGTRPGGEEDSPE